MIEPDYNEKLGESSDDYYLDEHFESDAESSQVLGRPIDNLLQMEPLDFNYSFTENYKYSENEPNKSGDEQSDEEYEYYFDSDHSMERGDNSPMRLQPMSAIAEDYSDFSFYEQSVGPSVPFNPYDNDRDKPEVEGFPNEIRKSPKKPTVKKQSKKSKIDADSFIEIKQEETKFVKYKSIPIEAKVDLRLPGAHLVSHVSNNMKHPRFSLERQLNLAVKKLNAYSKENLDLQTRLDASNIEFEFQKLRSISLSQEEEIKKLNSDNKSLQNINRNHIKALLEQERCKDLEQNTESILTSEGQVKILLERVRRLSSQLSESRFREKCFISDNEKLLKRNKVMKTKTAKLKDEIEKLSWHESNESGMNAPSSSSRMVEVGTQTMDDKGLQDRVAKLSESAAKLQKSLKFQRISFGGEIEGLKAQLAQSIVEQHDLESELESRDKDGRTNAQSMKQLKQAYEELMEVNRKLVATNNELQHERNKALLQPQPPPPSLKPSLSLALTPRIALQSRPPPGPMPTGAGHQPPGRPKPKAGVIQSDTYHNNNNSMNSLSDRVRIDSFFIT